MVQEHRRANKPTRAAYDAIKEYTDSSGDRWLVGVEFKALGNRPEVTSLWIQSLGARSPISRRMLSEIPLDKLFRDELAVEVEKLDVVASAHNGTTAHQGRAHSEQELRDVADIYLAAYRARVPVQKFVADTLGISVSTAAKRIMAARRLGFIASIQERE